MKPARARSTYWGVVLLAVFLAGCASSLSNTPDEELPLKPVAESDRTSNGRQQASIELANRGRHMLEAGQLAEATSMFQKSISLYPSNPYPYYFLAKARYMQQEYPKALPFLGQAERFFEGDPIWLSRVHVLRGLTYEALSRFDEAKTQYLQAQSKDPDNSAAQEGIERLSNRIN